MFEIEKSEINNNFINCWQTAGRFLNGRVQGSINSWIKADFNPPFLEHLSFRLGNQLFFIHLVDVDGNVETPGNINGLISIADECKGFACIMPMHKRGSEWLPVN